MVSINKPEIINKNYDMKKTQITFKNKAALITFFRVALVSGIIIYFGSAGNAQVTTTRANNAGFSEQKTMQKNQNVSTKNELILRRAQPVMAQEKMGEHAPDINDKDFQIKKAEWVKNYPEEYEAFLNKSVKSGSKQAQTSQAANPHKKIAEHAPFLDDPDYIAKKTEWINNYPQEYEQVMRQSQGSKTNK